MDRRTASTGKKNIWHSVGRNSWNSTPKQYVSKFTRRHQWNNRRNEFRDTRLFFLDTKFQIKNSVRQIRVNAALTTIQRCMATDLQDVSDQEKIIDEVSMEEMADGDKPSEENFLPSIMDGFSVVRMYKTCQDSGFDLDQVEALVGVDDVGRLELTPRNISVPIALMMLDPGEYPSRSAARKACRKARILIHRGPLEIDTETGEEQFDAKNCVRARVGDRVFPGDVMCVQVRIADGTVPVARHQKPPFELPVVFEDDHFAIVNKPAGIVVYAKKGGGEGFMTIRAAIPFAVSPPKAGTYSSLRRPKPVHRLDKPTSGLLIVAKTMPAMVNLSEQFRARKVKKTYTAIVNGIPPERAESVISTKEAYTMGFDVDPDSCSNDKWQVIDHVLDEKSASTTEAGMPRGYEEKVFFCARTKLRWSIHSTTP
ncbi:unnamed protein product [Pseudo-nitzschia multistriata]|uniref:Pseudouridine synthase RsuA/RluA-like domain-containing protein n=1 Tax=Pseudo-nitzschia multistriata TaxID=183589 RepID=A0A448ZRH8_9STRA|nr:unnamed protein product [Pseudo-nitzschia multistriata]